MDKNKTLNNVKRAINALPLNQAYRDSLNNTFKELVDNSGSEGGNTPSDPSSGGSNDYILPFTTEGNIDSKYFDEIKEAINSGKTIKHKNSNGSYRTIDYTIVKDEYIYCFIGNFDENTQIIDISKYGTVFEYNICSINGYIRQYININGDTPTQPALQSGYINSGYTFYDKLFGYRLNIFDIFTGECKIEDDIYTIRFDRESIDSHTTLGKCIIYSDSNNSKRITIVNEQEARDISIPGFVYAKDSAGLEYDEDEPTNYGDIFYINLRDYEYGRKYKKNNFGIPYPEERTSILLNNPLVSFKIDYGSCIYKNNTIDQLANELSYNKELIKGIAEINYLVNLDDYYTTDELNSLYTKYCNGIKLRFYRGNVYYDIYKADDYRNYYAIKDEKTYINFRCVNVGDDNWRFEYININSEYILDLTLATGTNTGTFDDHAIVYRDLVTTIENNGKIVIKGEYTMDYVQKAAYDSANSKIILRWSVNTIGEDDTSVTVSIYEVTITSTDYTTKVVNKTI